MLVCVCSGGEDWHSSLDREMAAGGQHVYRKENSHFLSLLAVGAVLLTIFFLFVGTSHHSTPYIDGGLEHPPISRRQSLEVALSLKPNASLILCSSSLSLHNITGSRLWQS